MPPVRIILCAFDFSGASRSAIVRAADLAERQRAALHLLHVTPLFRARMAHAGSDPEAGFRARARAFVDEVLGADDASEVVGPVVHEATGETPADGILRYAGAIGADLVVVGTHGRQGLEHMLLGSVAAETLRRSSVPVLVVPERAGATAPAPEAPVLAAVDFSAHTAGVLAEARRLAASFSAPIALAYVRDVPPERMVGAGARSEAAVGTPSRTEAHAALDALVEEAGLDSEAGEQYVVPGRPVPQILEVARRTRAGLVVLGTHGRRGWDRLRLGSVAEGVARQAPCAVLVVPTPAVRAVTASGAAASGAAASGAAASGAPPRAAGP